MAEVYILLGGNVGDKSIILEQVLKLIGERIGFIEKMSSLYATQSWGFESAPFWNKAIIVKTNLNPFEILSQTQAIERAMGRVKTSQNYEDRIIDVDLLFYDHAQINTNELSIPHSKIAERKFVLIPLNEIAPDKCHPASGLKVHEMLELCTDKSDVERIV